MFLAVLIFFKFCTRFQFCLYFSNGFDNKLALLGNNILWFKVFWVKSQNHETELNY